MINDKMINFKKGCVGGNLLVFYDVSLKLLLIVTSEKKNNMCENRKQILMGMFPMVQDYMYIFPIPYLYAVNVSPLKGEQIKYSSVCYLIVQFMTVM